MIEPATCRHSQASFLTKWLRSFATEPTASGSLLWRVGACRVRRSLAARRSPTFAMPGPKSAQVVGRMLFGFLPTKPNAAVAPVHPKGHARPRRAISTCRQKRRNAAGPRPATLINSFWLSPSSKRSCAPRRSAPSTPCGAPSAKSRPLQPTRMPKLLRRPLWIDSNTWCPRLTAAMILSGSAVQVKAFDS